MMKNSTSRAASVPVLMKTWYLGLSLSQYVYLGPTLGLLRLGGYKVGRGSKCVKHFGLTVADEIQLTWTHSTKAPNKALALRPCLYRDETKCSSIDI